MTLAARRPELQVLVCSAVAALLGLLAAMQPAAAIALLGISLIVALVVMAPVANVILLLIFTAIVPYSLQNRFGFAGGSGAPGLLLSDLLLILGLARGLLTMGRDGASKRSSALAAAMLVFLLLAVVQLVHGIQAGHNVSEAGTEFRFLLGFGAVILALPLLAEDGRRRRLFVGLAITGLLLGAWGLFQWLVGVKFSSFAGDIGVRPGVTYSSAEGQLQGGLYGFPVAVLMSFSVLLSGHLLTLSQRVTVLAILLLNTISLLLTYERTFWVATVVGILFIVARGSHAARTRMFTTAPIVVVVLFAGLSAVSPQTLPAARERLLSLNQYGSDPSVRYRITEARHVTAHIEDHLMTGSGLGAVVRWGRPYERVPARDFIFSHNGYLWLTWKLGIVGAIFLVGILMWAVLRRIRAPDGLYGSVALGAQAALVMALISSVTFPSFEFLSITAVMGVLLALCAAPAGSNRYGTSRANSTSAPVNRSTAW